MATRLIALFVIWGLTAAGAVHAQDPAIDEAVVGLLPDLRWGMSPKAVLERVKNRVRKEYQPTIAAEKDLLARDDIYEQAREHFRRIKGTYLLFNGRVSGWDVSVVGAEFRHGSSESMLYVDEENHRDYYFFIGGRLWKCFREYTPEAFSRQSFIRIGEALEQRFGFGEEVVAPREVGSAPTRYLRWVGRNSLLDAVDGGSHLVMVMSARSTVAQLARLRRSALPRGPKKNSIIDSILLSDDELDALERGDSLETALNN